MTVSFTAIVNLIVNQERVVEAQWHSRKSTAHIDTYASLSAVFGTAS